MYFCACSLHRGTDTDSDIIDFFKEKDSSNTHLKDLSKPHDLNLRQRLNVTWLKISLHFHFLMQFIYFVNEHLDSNWLLHECDFTNWASQHISHSHSSGRDSVQDFCNQDDLQKIRNICMECQTSCLLRERTRTHICAAVWMWLCCTGRHTDNC